MEQLLDAIPEGAGPIGLFSSDEFLPVAVPFDRALLEVSGPEVAVLFCADHRHQSLNARHARDHFGALGAHAFGLPVEHNPARAEVELPPFDLLYLPGGSPAELLQCLRGSLLWPQIIERWRAGAALAGSSAGAMALCAHCMVPRQGDDKPTAWGEGLGPIESVALAVHASSRPQAWLRMMATSAPVPLLAIDDGTGVLCAPGEPPTVIGPGRAWLIEPTRT